MRVMISEDDFRVAEIEAQYLRMIEGIEVVGKSLNATDTLEMLEETQPDLLLLDVYMPDRLGVDILHEVREIAPHVDIIMITAAKEKEVVEKSLKYGIVDYIIKPVTLDRFVQAIEEYQKRRKMIAKAEHFDQMMVDELLKPAQQTERAEEPVPKGIDPLTLEKVQAMLQEAKDGLTAEQASHKMGASKTTARRYLEYLITIRKGQAEMNYGRVGRPERKYYARN